VKNLQKMGGVAALYAGAAYVAGMLGFLLIIGWPDDPASQVIVLVNNRAVLHVLYLIVYQAWAVFLVVLVLALYDRFKAGSPVLMQTATAIGIIWAGVVIASGMIFNIGMDNVVELYDTNPEQAATVWMVITTVCDGLGGGNEILGGLWVLLVSRAAMKTRGLPRALSYLGLATGAAGVISALPGLGEAGMIFGLVQIVWFVCLGIIMLRGSPGATA